VILCHARLFVTIAGVNLDFQARLWALKFIFEMLRRTVLLDARIPLFFRFNLISLVIA